MFKQNQGKRGRLRRAFTITELVIVIAVIAILAAVLIPTFANVIENSKKSHDEQYEYELNVALANYTTSKGSAPVDYEELMLALADYDLCDTSNPFLLATSLRQDNTYLVWYPSTNTIALVNDEDYIITPNTTIVPGNAVTVIPRQAVGNDSVLGYRLCNTGLADGVTMANEYLKIYVEYGGNIDGYIAGESANWGNTVGGMVDAGWGQSFINSMNNYRQGYTYSESTANSLLSQAQTSSNLSISVSIPENGYASASSDEQAVVQQDVRKGLATLATLANQTSTSTSLQNKTITFGGTGEAVNSVLEGVVVDMSSVQLTSIGTTYRKSYEGDVAGQSKVETSSFSVNFGGVELTGLNVEANELISQGAEYQDGGDNGYVGGAYMFTYGLFGTVHADGNETVKISNLTISDVHMNLNGATQSVTGETVNTISDMAGIVVGYTQGNVVLENITIDGASASGDQGEFWGYDGVSALVGRAYADVDGNTLTIRNCSVSNVDIHGQRRSAGIIGYAGKGINVVIENVSLTNMNIISERTDGQYANLFTGVIGHFDPTLTTLKFDGIDVKDVTCTARYNNSDNDSSSQWTQAFGIENFQKSSYWITGSEVGKDADIILIYANSNATELVNSNCKNLTYTTGGTTYNITFNAKGSAVTVAPQA